MKIRFETDYQCSVLSSDLVAHYKAGKGWKEKIKICGTDENLIFEPKRSRLVLKRRRIVSIPVNDIKSYESFEPWEMFEKEFGKKKVKIAKFISDKFGLEFIKGKLFGFTIHYADETDYPKEIKCIIPGEDNNNALKTYLDYYAKKNETLDKGC